MGWSSSALVRTYVAVVVTRVLELLLLLLCAVGGPGQPHPQRGAQGRGVLLHDYYMTIT